MATRRRNVRHGKHTNRAGYWSIGAAHARNLLAGAVGGSHLPRIGYERKTVDGYWLSNEAGYYFYNKPGDPRYDSQVRGNPRSRPFYEVLVGNIGKVHEGVDAAFARRVFRSYVIRSKQGIGRAGGEDVTLWKDGEIIKEYYGRAENPWEPGLSRTWYSRGYQAGASGRYADMYGAWHAAKNKPRTPGGRVTAQESFFQGFMDTKRMFNAKWQPAHVRVNNHGQVQIRVTNPKSRRLGGGGKFASCVRQVSARGGAYDPKAVCAAAGMRKYGKARMQRWAAAGRRRAMRNRRRY